MLINNASSLGPVPLALAGRHRCEELEPALAVNLVGPFRLTKALFGALAASAREGRGALVINISSDAAVNAYPGWGAYGASKAALRHLTAIWAEEAKADGVGFLSLDPGDMDTPLHALAVPDADPRDLEAARGAAARDHRTHASRRCRAAHRRRGIAHDRRRPTPTGAIAQLLAVDADGRMRHLPRAALAALFAPGDLVVANDAATLAGEPARHASRRRGEPIEVRLAGWVSLGDPTRFVAMAFGAGDHRTRTEDRPPPPPLARGDRLALGPLTAVVERRLGHPRLFRAALRGRRRAASWPGSRGTEGRSSMRMSPSRWPCGTSGPGSPPNRSRSSRRRPDLRSTGACWTAWRRRGIGFATLTHAAGISSTGDPALDAQLPFDEPYRIPGRTAAAIDGDSRGTGASSRSARRSCARSRPRQREPAVSKRETESRPDASDPRRRFASSTPS